MTMIEKLRKHFFGVPGDVFAEIACVSRPSVSRWENSTLVPDLKSLTAIRDYALSQGLPWDDRYFFNPDLIPVRFERVPRRDLKGAAAAALQGAAA